MGVTDERFRVVDEGYVVVTGLPPCPPAPDVDLAPILDRLGVLESQMTAVVTDVADLGIRVDEQADQLTRTAETLTALLGGAVPALWSTTDAYPVGAVVEYNVALYVTTAAVAAGSPAPDAGTPWLVVDVVAMAAAP